MNDISIVKNVSAVIPLPGQNGTASTQSVPAADRLAQDEVEISDLGAMLSRIRDSSGIRVDKIARLRAEIAAGTFETPERINGTVDRLMEEL